MQLLLHTLTSLERKAGGAGLVGHERNEERERERVKGEADEERENRRPRLLHSLTERQIGSNFMLEESV